jgi:hypothetical protein
VSGKLVEELRRFHNRTAERTRRLLLDYCEVDVTAGGKWQNHDRQRTQDARRPDRQTRRRGAPLRTSERRRPTSASPPET